MPYDSAEMSWLDHDQQRSWRAFLVGITLLTERLDRDLREHHDLSLPEYEILVRLSEAAGRRLRMAVLADSVSYSRSRVTHTISRLEHSGFVERLTCTDDKRGVEAFMTDDGYAALRLAAPTHVAGVKQFLVDLVSPEDFEAVGRVFDAVTDKLVEAHPGADIR
ncbi:MAG: MarR family transcriptional regulator [Actinomycetota bacterium]|nr:MarR family transcriptional regulator [Actinomycetota bacterium]